MNTEEIINLLNDIIFDVNKASDRAYYDFLDCDFEEGLRSAEESLANTAERLANLVADIRMKELSAKIQAK